MRVREYLQESRIDIGTSGTKTFNLDYNAPITQLDLYFEATNGAVDNKASPFEKCISKIELVDGGEVLWDLPGEVAFAAYITDNEGTPYAEREEAANGSVRQSIPIRFGLKLFDPLYAFDPRRHKNPQLKFTFDEATVNTAGNDGYVSSSWTFSLLVRLMEDAPTPRGFLSYRTIESFTSVDGGARRVEMPTDKTIRYLMCRAYDAGVAMYTSISHHKLSVNGGEFVPVDLAARDFMNRHCETFKPIWLNGYVMVSNGVTTETWVGINHAGSLVAQQPGDIMGATFYIYGQIYGRCMDHAGNGQADRPGYLCVNGWAFHDTLMYAFGDRMKPEDWLDPRAFRKLDYFVTDDNAGADVDICVQQVYPY